MHLLAILILLAVSASTANAHPGGSIVVDALGQVFFVDTGEGVWRINTQGRLSLYHTRSYHWMAIDENGRFARSQSLGSFDRGEFERVSPAGAIPALIVSSDYPVVVGRDGGLYYVPYNSEGPRQMIRKMPDGSRSVLANLPATGGDKPMQWVNGIAAGPEGALYFSDNDAVRRIDSAGTVSTIRGGIQAPDCANPLPDTPKLPYLRGLAVHSNGAIYVVANGCRTVIQITPQGAIKTVLKAEGHWSPTGVAIFGNDIYVLEYLHTPGGDRREWTPRVRKIASDGSISTVATISRQK